MLHFDRSYWQFSPVCILQRFYIFHCLNCGSYGKTRGAHGCECIQAKHPGELLHIDHCRSHHIQDTELEVLVKCSRVRQAVVQLYIRLFLHPIRCVLFAVTSITTYTFIFYRYISSAMRTSRFVSTTPNIQKKSFCGDFMNNHVQAFIVSAKWAIPNYSIKPQRFQ